MAGKTQVVRGTRVARGTLEAGGMHVAQNEERGCESVANIAVDLGTVWKNTTGGFLRCLIG